jgi:hypothetical protein
MEDYFYRDKTGKEIGPIPLTALAQLRTAGVLDAETPLRVANSEKWVPCREVVAVSDPSSLHPAGSRAGKIALPPALVILMLIGAVIYGGSVVYKSVAARTTMTYGFSLDGKNIPKSATPVVKVDGQLFESGNHLKPGRHKVSVSLENVEPYEKHCWVFYGAKALGSLPLESSKGSLAVIIRPSPATITVRRAGEAVRQGESPLNLEGLPVGEYALVVRRGEYEENHPVRIRRQQRTEAKIDLNLGSVHMSSSPADTEFEMSGNNRQWKGKLPTRIDDVPAGNYVLLIHRNDYTEKCAVDIFRQQCTETNIVLNLGGLCLSTMPSDAEFELAGNGLSWHGKLPAQLGNIPGGTYQFLARRNEWALTSDVTVIRGTISSNKIEFPYGSIEVTSDPANLVISTNGVEIGRTPMTLKELKPGHYKLIATDGENDLTADVDVAPKEAATQAFVFHYGTVQLSSTPTGAAVIRKGKEIGRTPLTLNHIPVGETTVELRLQDYVSTNFLIQTVEGVSTQLSAILINEHYLHALKQAQEAFAAGQFDQSQKFLATALEIQPNDSSAMHFRDEVIQAVAKAKEALRAEQANAKAILLASLTWLDFQKVISDCTDTRQVRNPVLFDDGYYDNTGHFHKTGQHTEMQTSTESTFNPRKFSAKYEGKTFGFNCPGSWSVSKVGKDGGLMLKQTRGLLGSDNISVTGPASNPDALKSLQKGQKVTIMGVLTKCEPGVLVQTLYLENAELLDK